jgi:dolichyl-phosphate-mannose-protein mannosyltransferase
MACSAIETIKARIKGHETGVLFFLLLCSFLLRIYLLSLPPVPVFDEYPYIKGGGELMAGCQFSSLPAHPPLGFLLIGIGGTLWRGTEWGWRFFSVIMGTITIMALYILGKNVSGSKEAAMTAAFLIAFDPLSFVFSRLALLDGMLCLFILMAAMFLSYEKYLAAAIMLGYALAVKLSALPALLAALSVIIYRSFFVKERTRDLVGKCALLLILPVVIYTCIYAVFFKVCSLSGLFDFHLLQFRELAKIPGDSHLSSPWWSWFLIPQFLLLSDHSLQPGTVAAQKALELPALLWAGVLAFFLSLRELFASIRKKEASPFFLPLSFFCALYFPWAFAHRGTFFYYLLPSLPFLYLMLAMILQGHLREEPFYSVKLLFLLYSFWGFFQLYPHLMGWLQ